MRNKLFVVGAAPLALAMALAASAAHADGGVSVGLGSGGDLQVTIEAEAANVHFTYDEKGCDADVPCLHIDAGQSTAGVPVSAGGPCVARAGSDDRISTIDCKAQGVTSITFLFKKGGGWASYQGNGGEHAGGPCSPVPVTVYTGPDGGVVSVAAWNGCADTIVCDSPAGMMTGVEADASDVIRGTCVSVIRH
jgi:hypothetical protein